MKHIRKLPALLLVLCMLFSMVSLFPVAAPASVSETSAIGEGDAVWDGSSTNTDWFSADTYEATTEFYISSAAQLASLAAIVKTNDFSGKTVYLAKDIYLNNITEIVSDKEFTRATDHKWTTSYIICGFAGTFDGQGHSVYGLYSNVSDNGLGPGLFSKCGSTKAIRNLSVKYCDVSNGRGGAGGLVGHLGTGSTVIENCHVIGKISAGWGYAGGIAGQNPTQNSWHGTIEGCSFRGSVVSKNDRNSSPTTNAGAGGIIPIISMTSGNMKAYIRDCYVYGDVSATHAGHAGGIVGFTTNSNKSQIHIQNCGVSGTISGGSTDSTGAAIAPQALGGIVGTVTLKATTNIVGCYSVATLVAAGDTAACGGVVGGLDPISAGALSLGGTYYLEDLSGTYSEAVGRCTLDTYDYTEKATLITEEEATARAAGSLLVRLNEWAAQRANCCDWHIGHHGYPVHTTLPADTDYVSQFDQLTDVLNVATLRGAEIKLTNKNQTVLRFTGAVKDSYIAELAVTHTVGETAPKIEVGSLLMPTADIDAFNLTPSASYLIQGGLTSSPATVYDYEDTAADAASGTHYWYSLTAPIFAYDLSVKYSALSFVRVTDADGGVIYYDAPYDAAHNVRSALEIARMAYADRDTAGATVYSESKFSVLKAYLDNSVYVSSTEAGAEIVTDHGEYYASPYTAARDAEGRIVISADHLTADSDIHLVVNGVRCTDKGSYPNAEFNYESGKVTVTLRPSQSGVASVTLDPVKVVAWQDFGLDLTLANKITRTDSTATDTPVLIWSSSNPEVANVDEKGSLTLLSPGTTYVVATTTDGVVSNTVTVVVTAPQNRAADQQLSLLASSTPRINKAEHLALPTDGYGDAQIAMWYGDAKGAFSITIDDSLEWEFDAWNDASQNHDLPVTFIVPANLAGTDAAYWRKQIAAGQDVQSHSYSHSTNTAMQQWTTAQIWMDYYNSVEPIRSATGQVQEVLGYSYGYGLAEYAAKLFISSRATFGTPNYGDKINYQKLCSFSRKFSQNIPNMMSGVAQTYDPTNAYYGGWASFHFHQIDFTAYTEADGTEITSETQWLNFWFSYYLQPLRDDRSLWADTYRNVAKYGQERDSATLTVESVSDSAISVSIHDMMDDTVFTQALTVKIMVDETWQGVTATDANGNSVFAEIVTYDEGTFVFVDVVPDTGTVTVTAVK